MSQATQQTTAAVEEKAAAAAPVPSTTKEQGFFSRSYNATKGFVGGLVPDFFVSSGYTLSQDQIQKAAKVLFLSPTAVTSNIEDDNQVIETSADVRRILSGMMLSDGSNQAYLEKRMADASDLVYLTVAKIKESIYAGAEMPVDPEGEKIRLLALEFRAYVDMRGSQAGFKEHDLELFGRMMNSVGPEAFRPLVRLAQPSSMFPEIYKGVLLRMTDGLNRLTLKSYEPAQREFLAKVLDHVETENKKGVPVKAEVQKEADAPKATSPKAAEKEISGLAPLVREQQRQKLPKSQKGSELFSHLQRQLLSRYLSEHKGGAKLELASEAVMKQSMRIMEEMKMTENDLNLVLAPEIVAEIQERFKAVRFED